MPPPKTKKLSSLFRSAIRASDDVTLKQIVKRSIKFPKPNNKSASKAISDLAVDTLNLDSNSSSSDDSNKELSKEISSILCGGTHDSPEFNDDKYLGNVLEMPWFSSMSHNNISLRRKEVSRDRKNKWVFKSTQTHRFDRLVRMCGKKLGTDATIEVFGKLGRETGVKEYNALIGLCIEKARKTEDEEVSLQQITQAYQLLVSMTEHGFQLEEETYGPFLMLFIDMEMVDEFQYFCGAIYEKNPNSLSRLAYYEMLFWIRVNNDDKIKELCDYIIAADDDKDKPNFKENYLLALCESDRKKEILLLLEIIDITKFSSVDHLTNVFRSLGRLFLESFAEKYILALDSCDIGAENISNFIYNYAISVPNLPVEDVALKFIHMHEKLEVTPSSASYEKLIEHCCDLLKAHVALDTVDHMFEAGLTLSIETFHSILQACEESCDYNLVRRIYSVICHNKLKPNNETFRSMINLSVKMKDFEGAFNMIKDLEKMNLMPTSSMYNAIMAGYFREKNIHGALMVLKQMENADVKPDTQTFSYLIGNCDREEDIVKYYEELKHSGVQITKHIFMSLINAYAACGQFDKAKQIVLDKGIPIKNLNEIKSVLVSALAIHEQISDALNVYEEIKEAECNLEPKAILCLIEHLQSEGQLSRLLQLLKELSDPDYWIDGCCRVIIYCVQFKHLSSTVDLLKQLKDKFCDDEVAKEVLFDEVFSRFADTEPADMQFGLDLLQAIKTELDVCPSRKSLDFLLGACVGAKDLKSSLLIWKEYQTAGLPYNVLSFLRMYQVLLASGDHKSAKQTLNKIPKDDYHVRAVIKECQATFTEPTSKKKKKKKRKEMAWQ